ncbi:MAG: hypothetical protein LBC64_06355 [Fibromonadaceae bacterium]|jgi:hypothetical protein|nr:hypothetical protein [Fibromonadaceae bacterium]
MQIANNYYGYGVMEQHTQNAVRQNHKHQKNDAIGEFPKQQFYAQVATQSQMPETQSTQQETEQETTYAIPLTIRGLSGRNLREIEQETTQTMPGNNSQAIMEQVSKNFNCLDTGAYHNGVTPNAHVFSPFRDLGNFGETGFRLREGGINEAQRAYLANLQSSEWSPQPGERETLSDKIFATLSKNRITLSPNEKYNISVDKYCNVTVTGDDVEKAKAIERLLNIPGNENWGSLLQRENLNKDIVWGVGITKEQAMQQDKMLLENYLINASGGKVSLNDLYLRDDGRIMGLPPELDKLINSVEPARFGITRQQVEKECGDAYDACKKAGTVVDGGKFFFSFSEEAKNAFKAGDKEKAVKLAADHIFMQDGPLDIKRALANILKKGVDNIPDMNANYVLRSSGIAFA